MDLSEARIPVQGIIKRLLLEKEAKYVVTQTSTPATQIMFESSGRGNYFLTTEDVHVSTDESPVADNLRIDPNKTSGELVGHSTNKEGSSISNEEKSDKRSTSNDSWILISNGINSSTNDGVGTMLISPQGHILPSYNLQLSNTNNTTGYEYLLLRLKIVQDEEIKLLHIKGDAKLIVCQEFDVDNPIMCWTEPEEQPIMVMDHAPTNQNQAKEPFAKKERSYGFQIEDHILPWDNKKKKPKRKTQKISFLVEISIRPSPFLGTKCLLVGLPRWHTIFTTSQEATSETLQLLKYQIIASVHMYICIVFISILFVFIFDAFHF